MSPSPLASYTVGPVITVGVLGLSDSDRRVLNSIFALSARRTPRYVLLDKAETKQGDLLLVSSDQAKDLDYGRHWYATRERPVLIIGFETPRLHAPVIGRPLNIAKVLSALDLAVEKLKIDVASASVAAPAELRAAVQTPVVTAVPAIVAKDEAASNVPLVSDSHGVTLNVLVVDDSKAVQIYMVDKLKKWGLNATVASLGEEAMWACAKQRFDVIFLDIQMPGMDGYDVCKRVRGDRLNKNAKVFMLTSRSGTFDKVRGKLAGCDLYLTKPVDPMRLNEIIEAEIDARRKAVSPAVGIQPAPGLAMSGSA